MLNELTLFVSSCTDIDYRLYYDILAIIAKYRTAFLAFARGDEEILAQLREHTLTHYDANKGELAPYMFKLASTMPKSARKEIPVDFYADTLSETLDKSITKKATHIDDEVIHRCDSVSGAYKPKLIRLALSSMQYFSLLAKGLRAKDSTTKWYPKEFTKACLKLSETMGPEEFHRETIRLYNQYEDSFASFMCITNEGAKWNELDMGYIEKNMSRRVSIVDADGNPCDDPDIIAWNVKGRLKDKKIFKIPYRAQLEMVQDLLEEDISVCKFTIDDEYICRSLAGSLSIVNCSLFNQYNLFLYECIMNAISDTNGRFLVMGSSSIYILVGKNDDGIYQRMPRRKIGGIPLEFEMIDVTPDKPTSEIG